MKQGQDLTAEFPGLFLIHQRIRAREVLDHIHDEHELFLPLQGTIQVKIAGRTLRAGPGKMLYVPPGIEHSFTSPKTDEGERLIAIVSAKAWDAHGGGKSDAAVLSVSQLSKELLFHLLTHPETKAAPSLIATFIETIGEMLEATPAEGGLDHWSGKASDPRLREALKLINDKYLEDLAMDDVARGAGLSTRSFNRLFLNELGMTPKQLIILKRMAYAKILLKQKRSVTDVALEVGYNSVSQFIVTFRKITGQLPGAARS
jgi:AraC-like DNA-binding protein